jgi:hypothetical protein
MQQSSLRKFLFRVIAVGLLVGVAPTAGSSCLFVECHSDDDCDSFESCDIDGLCSDEGGSSSSSSGTSSNCSDTTESCASQPCCSSSDTCVDYEGVGVLCGANCTTDSGCVGNCCNPTQQGSNVCAPSSFCN